MTYSAVKKLKYAQDIVIDTCTIVSSAFVRWFASLIASIDPNYKTVKNE